MSENMRRVTICDVAAEACVSTSTVSRYLNQTGYVGASSANRIQKAIQDLKYVPNVVAQSLRVGKNRNILLVVPDICNPFYSQMAKKVQQLLREKGYAMTLFDSDESVHEAEALQLAKQMDVSGILLGSIDVKERVISELKATQIPVVTLNAYGNYPCDSVQVHGHDGTNLAVRHLIMLGHKHIGFAGGTPHSMIEESRKKGYMLAMEAAGLPIEPEDVIEIGFSQSSGYEAGRYFSKLSKLPTAICCANDQIALGLLAAMQERGISIPKQVSVTGMDNIPYAMVSNPSLTSVTNDSIIFAKEGVRMLFERIEGLTQSGPRDVVVRHELVVRASVAGPREE